jgi:hypothetical protein
LVFVAPLETIPGALAHNISPAVKVWKKIFDVGKRKNFSTNFRHELN